MNIFTIILWNPSNKLWDEILNKIPNIIEKKEIFINKKNLSHFIYDIYKYDTRCSHDKVLPKKINTLHKYSIRHLILNINIDNPTYNNNICIEAVDIKTKIRTEFNSKCPEGPQGLIHICDDSEQSKYVWDICNKFTIKYPIYPKQFNKTDLPYNIIVQKDINNKSNYRISPWDSTDKKWKKIFTFNALKNQDINNSRIKYTIYNNNDRFFITQLEHIYINNKYTKYLDFYIPSNLNNTTAQVYFKGIHKEFEISKNNIINSISIPIIDLSLYIQSQHDSYNYFLKLLNENEINYIIIRGFRFLPEKPDTDLDTIIHPDSWEKIESIYKKLDSERIFAGHSNITMYNNNKCWQSDKLSYIPMFMYGYIKNRLSTGFFRFDTYSDLFFNLNGEGHISYKTITPPLIFYNYVFNNKVKIDNYYIPNNYSELILLIFRCLYDKNGIWGNKHCERIDELIYSDIFNKEKFEKISNYVFKKTDNIYNKLINKNYKNIMKPDMNNILFILRKQGIKKNIMDYLLNELKNEEYELIDTFIVTLNNKTKFLKKFYGDKFESYKDDILKINDNQCLVFLTHFQKDKDPNKIKLKIRNHFAANIIHASDNPLECEIELNNLLNENIKDFKGIGTHYSQIKPECYNIFKIGSCRSELTSQTFNIISHVGYFHTTKEVLQLLDFMDGDKKIIDAKYPELIIQGYNNYDYKHQKQVLDNSHFILIEISSIKIFHDDNNYYQQDYLYSKYSSDKHDIMNIKNYKLTEEQLIEDVELIKNRINKPIIFMGAIDYNMKELNLGLTVNSNFRLENRNMITRVFKKYTTNPIIHEDIEPNIYNMCPIFQKTNKIDICHLSVNGKHLINNYLKNNINIF
jgi:hypothetical protein